MVAEYLTLDRLATQLSEIKQQLFSGCALLNSQSGQQEWHLYFYLGRILYATGGSHPMRRWVRNSTIAGVDVSTAADIDVRVEALSDISALTASERASCWEYYLLINWAKQSRIQRSKLIGQIQTTIVEVLFDIVRAEAVSCEWLAQPQLSSQLTLIDIERAFDLATEQHQQWQQAGLGDISPDRAMVIVPDAGFERSISPSAYQALRVVLDGHHSIREIAVRVHKSAIIIGQSFAPHLKSGKLRLVDLPDFINPIDRSKSLFGPNDVPPLIMCIDDSPFICDRLEQIFQEVGYQFIGVLDSMKAIPVALTKKPAVIFLDLVMPNANGYEICSRLRKVAAFRDTPIVILTGNDGVIDRVRAKVVGATDFVTKPIESELVLEITQKYLNLVSAK